METIEQIKPITGYADYFISNFGYVISHKRNRITKMQGRKAGAGYIAVNLKTDNKQYDAVYVHKLVAIHFIDANCKCVNHKDNNIMNNHIDNLQMCTQQQNIQYSITQNRKPKMNESCQITKPRAVVVYDPVDDITYEVHSMYRLAKDLGVQICAVYNACNGYQKTVKGLILRYK